MNLEKKPDFKELERQRQVEWEDEGLYHYEPGPDDEVYAIDTPPPTVSGALHMGHVYSYCHADFLARFWRMNGRAVFYPLGYDDNGLPTEHLVEREYKQSAEEMGVDLFRQRCLEMGAKIAAEYEHLWRRLGLSVDWRQSYRTISARAQKLAQWSFVDLYEKGYVYRREAPVLWCPCCATAIAQAELEERERDSRFCELSFVGEDGSSLAVATTRPELLPACAAIFVHPHDERYAGWIGKEVQVPLIGTRVPVLADADAEPDKGTGAVMCCTFGDAADVSWWRRHDLPLVEAIGRDGRMTALAGVYAGLEIEVARRKITADLAAAGLLVRKTNKRQVVRVHDRCGTPIEYALTPQFFVRLLEHKEQLLQVGEKIEWKPSHMFNKYRQWLDNLSWDWCISRQRPFGVPFPLWHCDSCGKMRLATIGELPVDPRTTEAEGLCTCGGVWRPETDVMDTWMTSSLTPQLAARWDAAHSEPLLPMAMRPLSHEIIRTWAFYSIAKSHYHWGRLPWKMLVVSGWGLAAEGSGKISKSKGGGPAKPEFLLEKYSADALRYWAAGTGLGKDTIIDEERMCAAQKMIKKLWNIARFSEPFIAGYQRPSIVPALTPADAWILARLEHLIAEVSRRFVACDYATARSLVEVFFWGDLADNYLEMAKKRLYEKRDEQGARYALYTVLRDVLKMLTPFIPHVTEEVYEALFAAEGTSLHRSSWPQCDERLVDPHAEEAGKALCQLLHAVRRYKSEAGMSLGTELALLQVTAGDLLNGAEADIASATRAQKVEIVEVLSGDGIELPMEEGAELAVSIALVEHSAAIV